MLSRLTVIAVMIFASAAHGHEGPKNITNRISEVFHGHWAAEPGRCYPQLPTVTNITENSRDGCKLLVASDPIRNPDTEQVIQNVAIECTYGSKQRHSRGHLFYRLRQTKTGMDSEDLTWGNIESLVQCDPKSSILDGISRVFMGKWAPSPQLCKGPNKMIREIIEGNFMGMKCAVVEVGGSGLNDKGMIEQVVEIRCPGRSINGDYTLTQTYKGMIFKPNGVSGYEELVSCE